MSVFSGRLARMRADGDGGFALIFVLFVTTVVMIGTATMLSVTTGGIKPARQNQDAASALAAAQAGVQRYLSALDANCPVTSIQRCSMFTPPATGTISGVIGTEAYTTSVVNPGGTVNNDAGYLSAANAGTLYVTSTGTSPVSANGTPASGAITRTITATLSGKPNPLRFEYFSDYETVGSALLNSYYGQRRIALTSPTVLAALGIGALSATASWNGASTSSPSGYGDNICDKLWYDDPSNIKDGSAASGRFTLKSGRTALPSGTDYAETGTLTPLPGTGSTVTRYAPCETTFSNGENFTAPVYSRDALYLSNGTLASSDGPKFTVPSAETLPALWTGWSYGSVPAAPADSSKAYRSFPVVGGVPAAGSGTVSTSPFAGLSLPSSLNITAGTCTFTGPTTITLSGSNALVTSPLTTSPGVACPATPGDGVYTVPVTTTTLYVKNASTSLTTSQLNSLLGLLGTDITSYSNSAGDAYVSGTLAGGKLSIATEDDVIVTGNILAGHSVAGDGKQPSTVDPASGEPSWSSGSAAIDLVATNDVRVYHPVKCADQLSADLTGTTAGWCPNDMTGLYATTQSNLVVNSDGSLKSTHPSLQYTNLAPNAEPSEIDAAVFALNGSFYADNFDRGTSLGPLTVSGGVYENHHGPLGEQWETPSTSGARANSGFKLQINYLNYSNAGLGYIPELAGGSALDPWQVYSVTSGGTS